MVTACWRPQGRPGARYSAARNLQEALRPRHKAGCSRTTFLKKGHVLLWAKRSRQKFTQEKQLQDLHC